MGCVKNLDMSINTVARKSGNKNKRTTGTKIIKMNTIIEKLTVKNKGVSTIRIRQNIIYKNQHRISHI